MGFWESILNFFKELFSSKEQEVVPAVPVVTPEAPRLPEVVVVKPDVPRLPIRSITQTLRQGMSGPDVVVLQEVLGQLKYFTGKALGNFGPLTAQAVRSFQQDNGLVADSIVGARTAAKLGLVIDAQTPPMPEIPADAKEGDPAWYEFQFQNMTYDPGFEVSIANQAKRIFSNKARYEVVEAKTGVPWWLIGVKHSLEASGDFRGVLHNGQRIIGTGKKTTIVPIGRGPFSTWEEAAVDALKLKNMHKITDWTLGNSLKIAERFNGLGYITGAGRSEFSPYIWSMTSVNDGRGKYTSDGKFDPNADANGQVGVAALLKEFQTRYGVDFKFKYYKTKQLT